LASFEEIAAEEMKRYDLDPSQRLQWHNRLMRIGRWLVDRNPANTNIPEHTLNHEFRAFDTAFSLQGRADRIDITADGLSITDYKTGTAPSNPKVEKGKSPQLPLLGWMAEKSADPRLKNKKVTELHYMRVTGKNDKPVEPKEIKPAPQMIEANENHLMTLLEKYYVEQSIYTAKILGKRDHDDYIQLKRVAEWAATSFEDDATDNDEEDSE
jgi:ATP-dependent helicase/nuclease subunit B